LYLHDARSFAETFEYRQAKLLADGNRIPEKLLTFGANTSDSPWRSNPGHAYEELRKAHLAANEDERTVEQLDPGGKIRAAIQAETSANRPEQHH
jgi:hypothetical protein